MFEAMDTNKDGKISHDELVAYMMKKESCCPKKCEADFAEADTNKDGKLNFEEFMSFMKKKMMEKHPDCKPKEGCMEECMKKMKAMFEAMDADKDGLVTHEEMKKAHEADQKCCM